MRRLLTIVVPLLGVVTTLASVFLLLRMTVATELLEEPIQRNLAIFGTMIAGVILLLGSVYISTRITVLLIGERPPRTFSNVRPDGTPPS
jgi:hypothetical protein